MAQGSSDDSGEVECHYEGGGGLVFFSNLTGVIDSFQLNLLRLART